MAGKTISQRLEELADTVGEHIPEANFNIAQHERELLRLAADVRDLEALPQQFADLKERVKLCEELPQQSARHDERLKAVEKGHDRPDVDHRNPEDILDL